MAKTQTKRAAAKTVAVPQQPASPLPTVATAQQVAPAAKPVTVALRGGAAVAEVQLTGKPYRTAAPHNQGWWKTLVDHAAAHNGKVAVADVVATQQRPAGVPAAFVGYAIRRGYLQAVTQ